MSLIILTLPLPMSGATLSFWASRVLRNLRKTEIYDINNILYQETLKLRIKASFKACGGAREGEELWGVVGRPGFVLIYCDLQSPFG